MDAVKRVQRLDIDNLIGGIRDISYQINSGNSTPLIKDLKIKWIFKNKAEEEKANVTDLILLVL